MLKDMKNNLIYLIILLMTFSCKNEKSTWKEEIVNNITFLKESMEYNNIAIKTINSDSSLFIDPNDMTTFIEYTEKALSKAKKVNLEILEKIRTGYGEAYSEKYIKSLELQIQGYKERDKEKALKGQILYDEYVDWIEKQGL